LFFEQADRTTNPGNEPGERHRFLVALFILGNPIAVGGVAAPSDVETKMAISSTKKIPPTPARIGGTSFASHTNKLETE
jgi:hypothetical protein